MLNKLKESTSSVKSKRASLVGAVLVSLFLTLKSGQEAQAQKININGGVDTTEITGFFRDSKEFTPQEIEEFNFLRENMLNENDFDVILEEIIINFAVKSTNHDAKVLSLALLDPIRETSLGKKAFEDIENDNILKMLYNMKWDYVEEQLVSRAIKRLRRGEYIKNDEDELIFEAIQKNIKERKEKF